MGNHLFKNYYKSIFDHSLDAILLTSPDGRIHRANQAACNMFQRTEEEICTLGREGIVDVDDPRLNEALKIREQMGRARTELSFKRKDGSKFIGDITSSIIKRNHQLWTVTIIRDITYFKETEFALRKAQKESQFLSNHDYLTGLLDRRGFVEKLENEIQLISENNSTMCLIFIDLDNFKKINDKNGHIIGDNVLKKLSKAIIKNVRPYGVVGRYGGDEFIICCPETEIKEAINIAERIRVDIECLEVIHGAKTIKTTASIGIAKYDASFKDDVDAFIKIADDNMYQAKTKRNYVYVVK